MGCIPSLSVIVPVRNEASHIGLVLADLMAQSLDARQFEILVVDGRSEDGTTRVVADAQAHMRNLRLLDNPRWLSSSGRNIGVSAARGPYLLFIDGHCRIPSRDMLSRVLDAFESGVECISRPQPLMPDAASVVQQAIALARSDPLGHHPGSNIYSSGAGFVCPVSAGCGYRADLLRALGGFNEELDACEDVELNLRVKRHGVLAWHDEEFLVAYRPRARVRGLLRQLFRYGYGRAQVLRMHGAPALEIAAVPLAGLAGLLVMAGGISLAREHAFWAIPACIAAYSVLVLGISMRSCARGSLTLGGLVAVSHFSIHLGVIGGFLSGLVRGPSGAHKPWQPGFAMFKSKSAWRVEW